MLYAVGFINFIADNPELTVEIIVAEGWKEAIENHTQILWDDDLLGTISEVKDQFEQEDCQLDVVRIYHRTLA